MKTKVLLLGTFHFASPGLDKVKNRIIDITNENSQNYLIELAARISRFSPNKVILEFDPLNDGQINERYDKYLRAGEKDKQPSQSDTIFFKKN